MENSEENVHIKDKDNDRAEKSNISQSKEEKQNERNEKEKSRKGEKRKREEITEKGGKRTEKRRNVGPATLSTDKNQDKPITKRDFEQFGEILVELQEQMFTRLLNAQKTNHTERREDDTRENQLNTGSDEVATASCSKTTKHHEIPTLQTSDTEDIFEEFEKQVDDMSEDGEQNDDEWLDLTSFFEDKEEKGEDLSEEVAGVVNRGVGSTMTEQQIKSVVEKVLIPKNCGNLRVPKCNEEVWTVLPEGAKMNDRKLTRSMEILVKSISLTAQTLDMTLKAKKKGEKLSVQEVITTMSTQLKLGAALFQELKQRRKYSMKNNLDGPLRKLCQLTTNESNELLFGNKLQETVKGMIETNKLSQLISKNSKNGNSRPIHQSRRFPKMSQSSRGANHAKNRGNLRQATMPRGNYRGRGFSHYKKNMQHPY